MLKRTLCALLALVMLVGAFPLAAMAEESGKQKIAELQGFPAANTTVSTTISEYYESEKNNSRDRANYLSKDHTGVNGDVGNSGDDYDFFKITVSKSYQLKLLAVSGADAKDTTRFKLTNSSGKVLKTASYTGTGGDGYDDEYELTYTLNPGTYYIRVSDSKSWVAYYFAFTLESAADAPKVSTSVNADTGKPVLKWKAVKNAKSYRIYRATSKDGTYKQLKSTTKTSFTDTTAKAGTKYYYKVMTISNGTVKNSAFSSIVSVVCDCARPDVWLTRSSKTNKTIVKWDDVSGAKEYKVYVATSKSGSYKLLGTTKKEYLSHSKASRGKTYYYKVKAISSKTSAANSAYSPVVSQKSK